MTAAIMHHRLKHMLEGLQGELRGEHCTYRGGKGNQVLGNGSERGKGGVLAFRCRAPFQRRDGRCLVPDTVEPEDEDVGAGGSISAASVLMQDCMVQKSPGVKGTSVS